MRSRKTLASKKKQSGRKNVDWKVLDIMHPDAAGIDVGGNEHWVAVSPDRDTRLGAPRAITAMARKLACLFYRLIKHGKQYVDKGTEYYEAKYREQQIRSLTRRAQKFGLQLVTPKVA
jgi:hypothetical protein